MTKEEPLTTKNFRGVFLDALEPFAREIAKEFRSNDKNFQDIHRRFDKIDKEFEKNSQEHRQIRQDILALDFKITELVRRDEFMNLVKRVEKLEAMTK